MSRVWWVCQGQTYDEERKGGYIWASLKSKTGSALRHWERLKYVQPGDIVVHYARGAVRALSRALSAAREVPRPGSEAQFDQDESGRMVEVAYHDLSRPIPLSEVSEKLRQLSIAQDPLTETGQVKQGYLWNFSLAGLRVLREASQEPWPDWVEAPLRHDQPSGTCWVFQVNVAVYDLEGALPNLSEFALPVRHYKKRIRAGDTVFLWRPGRKDHPSGIVAVGTVLSDPEVMPLPPEARPFIRDEGKFKDTELRVVEQGEQC